MKKMILQILSKLFYTRLNNTFIKNIHELVPKAFLFNAAPFIYSESQVESCTILKRDKSHLPPILRWPSLNWLINLSLCQLLYFSVECCGKVSSYFVFGFDFTFVRFLVIDATLQQKSQHDGWMLTLQGKFFYEGLS